MNDTTFTKKDGIKAVAWLSSLIDGLKEDKTYKIEVKEYKQKRSLDANSYFWVLADKLAAKMNLPKTELYRRYIKDIGGNNDTICIPTAGVEKLCRGWEHNGIGWQTDTFSSKIDGCTNVILYYGSSTYDKEQMSRLINLIVEDCKAVDIETMTPQQLEILNEDWGR